VFIEVIGVGGSARDVVGGHEQVVEAVLGLHQRTQVVEAAEQGLFVRRRVAVAILVNPTITQLHIHS
jgi:hypothetical protein